MILAYFTFLLLVFIGSFCDAIVNIIHYSIKEKKTLKEIKENEIMLHSAINPNAAIKAGVLFPFTIPLNVFTILSSLYLSER